MKIPGIACACGSPDLFSVKPGVEKLSCVGIAYARGEPDRGWCASCWWAKFGVADLFRMPEPTDG